jgi:hypothetical protein
MAGGSSPSFNANAFTGGLSSISAGVSNIFAGAFGAPASRRSLVASHPSRPRGDDALGAQGRRPLPS